MSWTSVAEVTLPVTFTEVRYIQTYIYMSALS